MSEDTEIVSNMMREGKYYEASRSWYQSLYIGPIAERSFFLVVAILSTFIALFAFLAVMNLLPITSRPGLIVRTDKVDEVIFSASRIGERGQPINSEMTKFMVGAYVLSRESYEAANYVYRAAFVNAHSDAPTWSNYRALYDRSNPQSPAAILGERGVRKVTIDDLTINDKVEPKVATVHFITELEGVANANKTRWTAVLQYYYSDLVVQTVQDPKTGDDVLSTQDPQFQVVNYVLSKNP